MMSELKPCPFCGGKAEIEHNEILTLMFSYVVCRNCGAKTGEYRVNSTYSSDEKAIEAWNRRAGEKE